METAEGAAATPTAFEPRSVPERVALVVLGLAFLAVNLATAELHTLVWVDEVAYADPAVNLYFGRGFTSTAWDQPGAELWASNTPLYQLHLFPWLCLFGFGPRAVRSLNYALVLACVGLLARGVYRLRLVRTTRGRVLLAGLLLTGGFGMTFLYRGARPDCPSMYPAALALLAWSSPHAWRRNMMLFGAGLLVPVSGIQCIPYLLAMSLILGGFLGRRALVLPGFMGPGVAVGLLLTLGAYAAIEPGSERRFLQATVLSGHGAWPDLAAALGGGSARPFRDRVLASLAAPVQERANVPLLAGCLAIAGVLAARRRWRWRSPLGFAIACGVLVPVVMTFAGKYPPYYTWMVSIPLMIGLVMTWEALRSRPREDLAARVLCATTFAASLLLGLPGQLALVLWDRESRDYRAVTRLVEAATKPGDVIYCDFSCYYPAKRRCAEVYLPTYRGRMTAEEFRAVDVVILRLEPYDWEALAPELAREWAPTARGVGSPPSCLPAFPRWVLPWAIRRNYTDLRVFARRVAGGGG